MKVIKTWKELVECLPTQELQVLHKKYLRKVFSVAASKFNNVMVDGTTIIISETKNQIKLWRQLTLPTYIKSFKYKTGTNNFTHITYETTGYTIGIPSFGNDYILVGKDGIITPFRNYRGNVRVFLNTPNDIVSVYNYNDFVSGLFNNKEYFRKCTWEEAGSYGTFLCIKNVLDFKRGMIVDYNNMYGLQSPITRFNNRVNFNISCDLNKTTLKELEEIYVNTTCIKQTFGCQRGCTNSCFADKDSKRNEMLKKIFIKLYKEIFE